MPNPYVTGDPRDIAPGDYRELQLRRIVADHQHCEIDGVIVDAFTANMLCKVLDALNETNREKFLAMPIARMADVGWKLVS
jgi:hypothetical protein